MNWTQSSQKIPQIAKIEGHIMHAFGPSQGPGTRCVRYLLGTWEVCERTPMTWEHIYDNFHDYFQAILVCTKKVKMGYIEPFRGNANGVDHPNTLQFMSAPLGRF